MLLPPNCFQRSLFYLKRTAIEGYFEFSLSPSIPFEAGRFFKQECGFRYSLFDVSRTHISFPTTLYGSSSLKLDKRKGVSLKRAHLEANIIQYRWKFDTNRVKRSYSIFGIQGGPVVDDSPSSYLDSRSGWYLEKWSERKKSYHFSEKRIVNNIWDVHTHADQSLRYHGDRWYRQIRAFDLFSTFDRASLRLGSTFFQMDELQRSLNASLESDDKLIQFLEDWSGALKLGISKGLTLEQVSTEFQIPQAILEQSSGVQVGEASFRILFEIKEVAVLTILLEIDEGVFEAIQFQIDFSSKEANDGIRVFSSSSLISSKNVKVTADSYTFDGLSSYGEYIENNDISMLYYLQSATNLGLPAPSIWKNMLGYYPDQLPTRSLNEAEMKRLETFLSYYRFYPEGSLLVINRQLFTYSDGEFVKVTDSNVSSLPTVGKLFTLQASAYSSKISDLRSTIEHLQTLANEQRMRIEELRNNLSKSINEDTKRIERLTYEVSEKERLVKQYQDKERSCRSELASIKLTISPFKSAEELVNKLAQVTDEREALKIFTLSLKEDIQILRNSLMSERIRSRSLAAKIESMANMTQMITATPNESCTGSLFPSLYSFLGGVITGGASSLLMFKN